MSWDAYVTNMVATKNVSRAGIYGHDGSLWTPGASAAMKIAPAEFKNISAGFVDPGPFFANGIHLEGKKYKLFRADNRTLLLKDGESGWTIVKTGKAVIVTFYTGGIIHNNCSKVAEDVADYLISVGY